MTVLYIREQGATVLKRGERIVVQKDRKILLEFPVSRIDSISVTGYVQLTAQAIHMLMRQGIDIYYFSYSGNYIGHMASDSSKNIFLRLAQYRLYQNMESRLKMAGGIVRNKIWNQLSIVKNHRWEDGEKEWRNEKEELTYLIRRTKEVSSIQELMGLEGRASHIYFHIYEKMLCCEFSFHGRNRRPPRDPVNALLSLGYAFLTKEVTAALEAEGFEMYLGFLHGVRYGRKSLPLDLVEEFRQPVVDCMVLKLLNKRMLQKEDFSEEENKVTLKEGGFQVFCREYEKWMTEKYRPIIQEQAKKLKNAVQKKEEYQPFCINESSCM